MIYKIIIQSHAKKTRLLLPKTLYHYYIIKKKNISIMMGKQSSNYHSDSKLENKFVIPQFASEEGGYWRRYGGWVPVISNHLPVISW